VCIELLSFAALFGGFASYLASSELIFADVFGQADEFPLIFGALAVVMGVAALINSFLVERVGLRRLINLVRRDTWWLRPDPEFGRHPRCPTVLDVRDPDDGSAPCTPCRYPI